MTERDFAYWLQGFFEIQESPHISLSVEQCGCIMRHANLVRTIQKTSVFVAAVELALKHRDSAGLEDVVSSYFEHVIDPQHPDQTTANNVHAPYSTLSSTNIRC